MEVISASVIVRNEEARIEGCLCALRPLVDEIIVVDQSSTDNTVNLALKYADTIVKDKAHGYAEASMILAHKKCVGTWILRIDADEVISEHYASRLHELADAGMDSYYCQRDTYLNGKLWVSEYDHTSFFRKGCVNVIGQIHDMTLPFEGVRSRRLEGCFIEHRKTMEEQILDNERYEALGANDAFRERFEEFCESVLH